MKFAACPFWKRSHRTCATPFRTLRSDSAFAIFRRAHRRSRHRRQLHDLQRRQHALASATAVSRSSQPGVGEKPSGRERERSVRPDHAGGPHTRSARPQQILLRSGRLLRVLRHRRQQTHRAGEPERLTNVPVSQNFFSDARRRTNARTPIHRRRSEPKWAECGNARLPLVEAPLLRPIRTSSAAASISTGSSTRSSVCCLPPSTSAIFSFPARRWISIRRFR